MFIPGTPPDIAGIFDRNRSAFGDPFTDFGWMLSLSWDTKDPASSDSTSDLLRTFMAGDGYASRQKPVHRYEKRTSRTFDDERCYCVLAVYKFASLGKRFFRRYVDGTSDDSLYPKMEEGVHELTINAVPLSAARSHVEGTVMRQSSPSRRTSISRFERWLKERSRSIVNRWFWP